MSSYFYSDFHPFANLSDYPTIIDSPEYVDPQIASSTTFTLSDLYSQQSVLLDQYNTSYSLLSPSDHTQTPPNSAYFLPQTLIQNIPRQSPRYSWGVRPDPNPIPCTLETDPIPSIRRTSLPPNLVGVKTSVPVTPLSPETDVLSSPHSEFGFGFNTVGFLTSSLEQDKGYHSSSSTSPTSSPTPSPTSTTFSHSPSHSSLKSDPSSDSGYRSPPSQLKHTDFRRRRADRRRSKLLEIASVLPFRATDPDEMSSHDKRRCYVGTLEEYVVWLEKEFEFFGGVPASMKKVLKHKGMSCRSLRTMLAHFQDEAHRLHEQVQAQEREALELQASLDAEERHDQELGFEPTSSAPSLISGPFTTVPIQPQSHFLPQLQGYDYSL